MSYNIFLERYKYHSWSLVNEYLKRNPCFEFIRDDLHSMVFCETMSLIVKYETRKGRFYGFWKVASLRLMNSYLKKHYNTLVRHSSIISLDYYPYEKTSLHEIVGVEETFDSDQLSKTFLEILDRPEAGFKTKEKEVIRYNLSGYDFKEISIILKCSVGSIYSAYKNAVKKIAKVYKGSKK